MKNTIKTLLLFVLMMVMAVPASANYNSRYGETNWSRLPLKGMLSKNIWVGSWWAYKWNGIALRHNATSGDMNPNCTDFMGDKCKPETFLITDDKTLLSPAEKWDLYVGREDLIEREDIAKFVANISEKSSEVTAKIERRRDLIRILNKMIDEKREDPAFDWKDTDEGKEYLEVSKAIEEAEASLAENKPTIDTATEYEIWHHGRGQFGVQGWWGHCNAWAGAAIMEPEPRKTVTVEGIEFTAGDVKAYLTETYMELQSSFWGTRNNYHGDEEGRSGVDYKDVTAATFHITFADTIGNKDEGFVIDRYTGSEVWNQPVKAFRSSVEVLNDGASVEREIFVTEYPWSGKAETKSLGTKTVWEVSVTTTMWWVTDGLPHEALTRLDVRDDDYTDSDFANSWTVKQRTDDQIHLRTLNYVLYLDKAPTDADAEILGDGVWNHGDSAGYEHTHPDFIWKPTANINNSRDYENEFVDYKRVVEELLPGSIEAAEDPTVEPSGDWKVAGAFEIPDAQPDNPVEITLEVTGAPENIAEMEAHVVISHTYIGDLKVSLEGPNGKRANLKKTGSGGSDDNIDRTWDVKKFKGINANGTWKLIVSDKWSDDLGTVDLFELNFK